MATTINAYNVSLGLAAGGFVDGAQLAREEASKLNRAIARLADPAEKVAAELNFLEQEHIKAATQADAHAEAVARLQRKLDALRAPTLPVVDLDTTRAEAAVPRFTKASDSLVAHAKGMAAAFVGFEVISRTGQAIGDSMENIDDLVNRSKMLGEAVPDLQRFEFALLQMANLDSQSAGQFLVKMQRSIGEAALGGKEAAATFNRLGLDLEQLKAMTPTAQFDAVAEAIRGVENPTERLAETTKIFGRSGADLLPVLNATGAEFRDTAAEVDRLGMAIDTIDAEKVAIAADEVEKMQLAMQAAVTQLTVELAPALTDFATQMSSSAKDIAPIIEGTGELASGLSLVSAVMTDIKELSGGTYGIWKSILTLDTKGFVERFGFDNLRDYFATKKSIEEQATGGAERVPVPQPDLGATDVESTTPTTDDATKAAERQTAQIKQQTEALEHQILVMERGETIARQIELSEAGVADADIERLIAAEQKLELLKQEDKVIQDIAKNEADAAKDAAKAIEDQRKEVEKQAADITKSVETPLDTLANKLEELNYLFDVEEAITKQTFDAARQKLLDEATKDIKTEQPKAMEVGSQEAYKFITGLQNREQEQQIKVAQRQLIEAQAQRRAAERSVEYLREIKEMWPKRIR